VHAAVFALSFVSIFLPKKDHVLLTDMEITGEGELQEILDNSKEEHPAISPEMPKNEEKQEEVEQEELSSEKNQQVRPDSQETDTRNTPQEQSEEEKDIPSDENLQPVDNEQLVEGKSTLSKEESVSEEKPQEIEESVPKEEVQEIKEEPIPREEQSEKIKETSKQVPLKKRNRKALRDVIKKAEKQKAKVKNRKKILEITENASRKKEKDSAFNKMLNGSMRDFRKNSGKGTNGKGFGRFGTGTSLVDADYEMISSQVYPHWAVPSGVRDAENIVIEISVQIADGGEVIPSSVKILDEKRYASDYIFRAAADSARRAILEASPLRIPKDKIELFRNFIFRFNLKEALGG
jgi:hypothetical protein